jgi:hypothetical protein
MKVKQLDETTYELELSQKRMTTVSFKLPPQVSYELELYITNKRVMLSAQIKEWIANTISSPLLLQEVVKQRDVSLGGSGVVRTLKMDIAFLKVVREIAKKNNLPLATLLRKIVVYNLRKAKENK